jgi:hypothetical protein
VRLHTEHAITDCRQAARWWRWRAGG